jgi:hypothetical protein
MENKNEELLDFVIVKEYKGHSIRIKPILDKPKTISYVYGDHKMIINNGNEVKRELHVLFEMVDDKDYFDYFINERLKYIGSFLNAL